MVFTLSDMGHGDLLGAMQGNAVFDGLLAQCRDVACARLDEAVAGMLEKSEATIQEILDRTYDRKAKQLYQEAQEMLRKQRAEIARSFRDAFLAEFKLRSIKGKKTSGAFDAVRSSFELSLLGDDDLEETLKFNEMAARLRRICEDEINALDQRVGVLLGDAELAQVRIAERVAAQDFRVVLEDDVGTGVAFGTLQLHDGDRGVFFPADYQRPFRPDGRSDAPPQPGVLAAESRIS